jgi:hypothetical protein
LRGALNFDFFCCKHRSEPGAPLGLPFLNKDLFVAHETIVILGIPIDNYNTAETIEQILSMVDAYGRDVEPGRFQP